MAAVFPDHIGAGVDQDDVRDDEISPLRRVGNCAGDTVGPARVPQMRPSAARNYWQAVTNPPPVATSSGGPHQVATGASHVPMMLQVQSS